MNENKINIREIGYDEVKEKIKNHLLWLRGSGKEEDRDFSNLDFTKENFDGIDYSCENYDVFTNSNLTEANFKNSNLKGLNFDGVILNGTDLRNTLYDINQFTQEQLSQAILTDEDYKKYQEKKKLEEENKELKKEVGKQEKILKNTSDKQTDKLLEGFKELKENFALEERRWLVVSIITFFLTLSLGLIVFIDSIFPALIKVFLYTFFGGFIFIILAFILAISEDKEDEVNSSKINFLSLPSWYAIKQTTIKAIFFSYGVFLIFYLNLLGNIGKFEKSLLNISQPYYTLIPISIILFSFLYFAIYQYSKAKKLRIENQNKIAMIYGFQALRAQKGDGIEKGRFYDNISNVVFTPVFEDKNLANLPIDKILDLIKTTIESTTKK